MNDPVKKTKRMLEGKCWHEIKEGTYGRGTCIICGSKRWFGWYCPKSPDHLCKYFSKYDEEKKLRFVMSINGERIYLSEKYTKNYNEYTESEDECIYCWLPQERK